MGDGGSGAAGGRTRAGLGTWADGEDGRPVFVVDAAAAGAGAVRPAIGPPDPWHLVGAPGLLALAHVSGRISLHATAGGMVRLADRTAPLLVDGSEVTAVEVRFGVDHATWTFEQGPVRVERTVSADPASASLGIHWAVSADRPVTIEERWDLRALPIVPAPLMSRPVPVPSTHRGSDRWLWRAMFAGSGAARSLTDAARALVGRRHPLRLTVDAHPPAAPFARTARWAPRPARRRPRGPRLALTVPPAAVLALGATPPGVLLYAVDGGLRIGLGPVDAARYEATATLALDDPLLANGAVAAGPGSEPRPEPGPEPGPEPAFGSETAAPRTASRDPIGDPQLAREAEWHVHQLRALRVPDPWIDGTFVMQGSAYAFVHGIHGAVRDEAFVVAALAGPDPATARGALVAMAAMARPDGTFAYAHAGYGAALSGGVHVAPTDLPLFYLWAVAEYLAATGDAAVLEERARPRGRSHGGWRPSVGEVAVGAATALDRHVGRGPHGLLRVGSGDWADPISLMVRRRRAFHRHGESAFNTGMALAVLPMAAGVLEALDPPTARRCADLAGELDRALERAWTGEWYRRGYDGRGGAIGETACFLDAQLWPLIAGHGSRNRRAALVATVADRCDDPSPIGPAILDRPQPVRLGMLADGWDCNGGVWAALGGLAAWAYALHDPPRAEALLRRLSFAGQQAAYPRIWYGQWSGPDARNSRMGDRPGETYVHPATPMAEFPVMNSNAHAGPLLGLRKLRALTRSP